MRLDKEQRKIIKHLSEKYDLSDSEILEIIKAPMRFIREKVAEIHLVDDMSKEEFEKATFNFNIPSIGKLHANYNNYKRIQNARRKRDQEKNQKA